MRLLWLARHGNTFRSDQIPVWVGGRENPDLTPEGEQQAHRLGVALQQEFETRGWPALIRVSPLQRTQQTLEIATQAWRAAVPPIVADERLREIDYGLWAGRTSGEIRKQWPDSSFENWENQGLPPPPGQWGEDAETLHRQAQALIAEQKTAELWITSGGKIKLIAGALGLMESLKGAKISTGAWSRLERSDGQGWSAGTWNHR